MPPPSNFIYQWKDRLAHQNSLLLFYVFIYQNWRGDAPAAAAAVGKRQSNARLIIFIALFVSYNFLFHLHIGARYIYLAPGLAFERQSAIRCAARLITHWAAFPALENHSPAFAHKFLFSRDGSKATLFTKKMRKTREQFSRRLIPFDGSASENVLTFQ
jgi:hypothetical protein